MICHQHPKFSYLSSNFGAMKIYCLLLLLPFFVVAQTQTCAKTAMFYSRELFPGEVTVARTIALSGFESDCKELPAEQIAVPQFLPTALDRYQFYPLDGMQQDLLGREISLDVDTEQLVNHLVFDRN